MTVGGGQRWLELRNQLQNSAAVGLLLRIGYAVDVSFNAGVGLLGFDFGQFAHKRKFFESVSKAFRNALKVF